MKVFIFVSVFESKVLLLTASGMFSCVLRLQVLLRRGETKEGEYIHVPAGWNDHDLFGLIWGPATAALSFVFDRSGRETILQVAILQVFVNCMLLQLKVRFIVHLI